MAKRGGELFRRNLEATCPDESYSETQSFEDEEQSGDTESVSSSDESISILTQTLRNVTPPHSLKRDNARQNLSPVMSSPNESQSNRSKDVSGGYEFSTQLLL